MTAGYCRQGIDNFSSIYLNLIMHIYKKMIRDPRLLREPKTCELRTISNMGLKTQNTEPLSFAEHKTRDPKNGTRGLGTATYIIGEIRHLKQSPLAELRTQGLT